MKTKTEKKFDSVAQMRKSRDRISKETTGMTASEIIGYFEKRKRGDTRESRRRKSLSSKRLKSNI